jgi:hypothetical protein
MKKPKATGLVILTVEEQRNGWTRETLTAYLKDAAGTELQFRQDLLLRAREAVAHAKRRIEVRQLTEPELTAAPLEVELEEAEMELAFAIEAMQRAVATASARRAT